MLKLKQPITNHGFQSVVTADKLVYIIELATPKHPNHKILIEEREFYQIVTVFNQRCTNLAKTYRSSDAFYQSLQILNDIQHHGVGHRNEHFDFVSPELTISGTLIAINYQD